MRMELKEPKTFQEQLELLRARGCIIDDEKGCLEVLRSVNYYRLSAYFLTFRDKNDQYCEGTNFYSVYCIYEFDRKIREILWSAIGAIEISLRTQLAYYHAHTYGASGYLDEAKYNRRHNHAAFLENFEREVAQNKRIPFVKHHIEKYNGIFPIWVGIELFSFGMLSRFYADLVTKDQKRICAELGQPAPHILESWLRCCTDLRNICAHYGRLYDRRFTSVPATPKEYPTRLHGDVFSYIMVLKELYPFPLKWNTEYYQAICNVIEEYEESISLVHIGFPDRWKALLRAKTV